MPIPEITLGRRCAQARGGGGGGREMENRNWCFWGRWEGGGGVTPQGCIAKAAWITHGQEGDGGGIPPCMW